MGTCISNKISIGCWFGLLLLVMLACESNVQQEAAAPDILRLNAEDKERSVESQKVVNNSPYQNGDVIFHSSLSSQSMAIQAVTNSPYSHVGILYLEKGQWYVYEAIRTVQATPLKQWIARGKNEHYVVKRLKNTSALTSKSLQKMKEVGQQFQGKSYDLKFEWSDEKMYCSELVWKIYDQGLGIELGKLEQIKDFNFSAPIVQQKIKERYGQSLPLEQWVISPAQIFNCNKLETVFESGTEL